MGHSCIRFCARNKGVNGSRKVFESDCVWKVCRLPVFVREPCTGRARFRKLRILEVHDDRRSAMSSGDGRFSSSHSSSIFSLRQGLKARGRRRNKLQPRLVLACRRAATLCVGTEPLRASWKESGRQ